jgi:acetylornithine aminotransferase
MDATFFYNSDAEANETALKLTRLYAGRRKVKHPKVLVMENSFHGRTLATLAATGNPSVHCGFEPLMPGFVRIPYNDLTRAQEVADREPNIVAVLVEPVQGEGGVRVASTGYLQGLRTL